MPLNHFQIRSLLALMVIVLVSASTITYLAGRHVLSSNQQVIQHLTVIQDLQQTLSTLKDAETGQRGFLLTGNDKYLRPYKDAIDTINADLAQLQQESDAGLLPPATITKISSLTNDKLTELNHTIDLRRNTSFEAAQAVVNSDAGRKIMDDLRNIIDQSIAEKESTLQTLRHSADNATMWRTVIFLSTTGIELLFCFWAYQRIVSEMERRAAAAIEIRRQKDLLAVTLSSIGDAVMVTDVDSNVTFMNAVAESLTGWILSDARGKNVIDIFKIINEDSRNTVESPVEKVLRTGLVVGLANHTLLIRKDGSEIPIDDSGAPIRDEKGHVYGVVLVFRDFSEHKSSERQLLLAKTDAEAASRAKDHFLANLSHELRTPLTPVVATLHLWESSEDFPEPLKNDIRMLRRNVDLEARLIDDLLDLTRITKGKLYLNLETLDLHDLLSSVMAIVRNDITAKQLHLSVQLNAKNHYVRADPARLQQVTWNILKNAVKFTNPGGSISVQTADGPDQTLSLTVIDTGIGMSPATLARLFLPFEQAVDHPTRNYGGLGLGMSIAKALVESQRGSISASSDGLDKGSTFTFTLPVVEPPAPKNTTLPPATPKSTPHSLRILLVEDHLDSANVMNRILVGLGHKVHVAHSIAAALAFIDKLPFDLLLSDLGLPDGTGLDLIKQIHALRYIPAIALTGFGMEEDVSRSFKAGFISHLTKPINFQKLEEAIRQVANP